MSRREPEAFIERFGTVRRRITAMAAQAYAQADIGHMQAKLIRHIGRSAPISQAELARATDQDAALTGRAIQSLIERGLVARERSDEDRREYVVSLTAPGKRMFEKVTRLRSQLAAQIVAALDERDLADFDRIADKILAATAAKGP